MGIRATNLMVPSGSDSLIRNLIHERVGVFFENGKSDLLLEKLAPLVIERGFNSYLEYYYLLKYDETERAEWQNVVNAISVQETYFWREIDQIKALVNTILPQFARLGDNRTFRIWSAACASGEEPLSIAIALTEAGWFDRMPIEIVATDASTKAIEKARQNNYRERAFRNLPPDLRNRYFTHHPDRSTWSVRQDIHERVRWDLANLVDQDQIAPLATANVIFCRNVFIYFSDSAISQVVKTFAKYLLKPGYLFVGASESLVRLGANYSLEEIDDAFVYLKPDESTG